MYYRLTDRYKLRGWQRATSILIDRTSNVTEELSAEEFCFLLICDGETAFDESSMTAQESGLIKKYIGEGVIEALTDPKPLDESQIYQLYPNRFVDSVFWSITGKCNYKCRHCYLDAPEAFMGEMTHEEALTLIDQMEECGVLSVDLSGGEPLVRPDFWSLVDRLLDKEIGIGVLYTNGWLLDRKLLEGFLARGIRPDISISFDGAGHHDWMRGVKGAEEAALRAFRLCQEYGFKTDAEMCLHRGNRDSIRETVRLLKEYDVTALKLAPVTGTELWKMHAEGNELPLRDYYDAAIEYIPHFYEDGMPMDVTLSAVACLYAGSTDYEVVPDTYPDGGDNGNCLLCAAARLNTYIAPDGRVLPCMPMAAYAEQSRFPKVQEIGLRSALSDSGYMKFVDCRVRDLIRVNRECADCKYLARCGGGCRANALSIYEIEGRPEGAIEEKDMTASERAAQYDARLMGRDPYQCILFKEGYVDRIYRVADEAIAKYC